MNESTSCPCLQLQPISTTITTTMSITSTTVPSTDTGSIGSSCSSINNYMKGEYNIKDDENDDDDDDDTVTTTTTCTESTSTSSSTSSDTLLLSCDNDICSDYILDDNSIWYGSSNRNNHPYHLILSQENVRTTKATTRIFRSNMKYYHNICTTILSRSFYSVANISMMIINKRMIDTTSNRQYNIGITNVSLLLVVFQSIITIGCILIGYQILRKNTYSTSTTKNKQSTTTLSLQQDPSTNVIVTTQYILVWKRRLCTQQQQQENKQLSTIRSVVGPSMFVPNSSCYCCWTRQQFYRILITSIFLSIMLVTGILSLQYNPLSIIIISRNITNIVLIVVDCKLFHKNKRHLDVWMMTIYSILLLIAIITAYHQHTLYSVTTMGILWMIANCIAISAYQFCMKQFIFSVFDSSSSSSSSSSSLSSSQPSTTTNITKNMNDNVVLIYSVIMIHNVVCIFILLPIAYLLGEVSMLLIPSTITQIYTTLILQYVLPSIIAGCICFIIQYYVVWNCILEQQQSKKLTPTSAGTNATTSESNCYGFGNNSATASQRRVKQLHNIV